MGYGGSTVVKVWIVQESDYECQDIVAVFSDEGVAKTFVEEHNANSFDGEWRIPYVFEEWEVV